MQLLDYLRSVKYAVTGGSRFMWNCYGDKAWFFDTDFASAVIDRETGTVYEVTHCDDELDNCHKWINPDFIDAYISESLMRKQDPWTAYDDVNYKQVDAETILKVIAADTRAE